MAINYHPPARPLWLVFTKFLARTEASEELATNANMVGAAFFLQPSAPPPPQPAAPPVASIVMRASWLSARSWAAGGASLIFVVAARYIRQQHQHRLVYYKICFLCRWQNIHGCKITVQTISKQCTPRLTIYNTVQSNVE